MAGRPTGTGGTPDAGRSLPWRDRIRLRWDGRRDGRYRRPRVTSEPPPLSTARREELMAERDLRLQRIWEDHVVRTTRISAEIEERRQLLTVAKANAERTRRECQQASSVADPAALSERRFGEVNADERLVRRRRQREHDGRAAAAATRIRTAERDVTQLEADLARLTAKLAAETKRAVEAGQTTVRLAVNRRAVYDRALLARHPHRHLIGPRLDARTPPLPGWLTAQWSDAGKAGLGGGP